MAFINIFTRARYDSRCRKYIKTHGSADGNLMFEKYQFIEDNSRNNSTDIWLRSDVSLYMNKCVRTFERGIQWKRSENQTQRRLLFSQIASNKELRASFSRWFIIKRAGQLNRKLNHRVDFRALALYTLSRTSWKFVSQRRHVGRASRVRPIVVRRTANGIDPMSTSLSHNSVLPSGSLGTWISYIFNYIWDQVSLFYRWNVSNSADPQYSRINLCICANAIAEVWLLKKKYREMLARASA